MKKQYEKTFRQLHVKDEYLVTDTNRRLMQDIEKIEGTLKQMRSDNRSEKQIDDYLENAMYETQLRHWQTNQRIVEESRAELDKIGESWKRKHDADPARSLLDRQRAEARYRLMSDDELIVDATSYIDSQGEDLAVSPDHLEALALEMDKRDGDTVHSTRQVLINHMRDNKYTEPWRYTPEGDKLVETIQAHDTKYGEMNISQDGQSLMTYEIETLLNEEVQPDD